MEALEQRIVAEGRNLGQGILKVDSFVNHQVDPALMMACGQEFARLFADTHPTKILTAEISGIAPALTTGLALNIPIVYARKTKPVTMPDTVFLTTAPSHTKKRDVEIMASPEYLQAGERVLIIDDFLATGQTILALARIAKAAGAEVVGVGALIEKTFEGGRHALKALNVPVESLALISDMRGGQITFAHPHER
ncbi:MAG: xanthine phosphoribosyltransferase [Chloroflexi bacterium]|nr:xanthine phosphoribosyltransferase [Chloroflexota bacterium]MCL5273325.1 xanthine phosphoribosyltransferase [Chloroflexota bacterium]